MKLGNPIPCDGCGRPFVVGSNSFIQHLKHCTNVLLRKASGGAKSSIGPAGEVETDDLGNPFHDRTHLESRCAAACNGSSHCQEPFIFTDNEGNRWELSGDDEYPAGQYVEAEAGANLGVPTFGADFADLPTKIPFKKDVTPDSGDYSFSISLMDLLQHHKTDLKLYDEIVNLISRSLKEGKINLNNRDILSRKKFLQKVQNDFETTHLKPKHVPVTLSNGTKATVSLFDIEFMILSLLTDETLMKKENMAEGYDIFTGIVDPNHPANQNYGEVHTGDAWEPARKHFCGDEHAHMPISLIVFGDKTHTDLHGSLAVTPIIFTLSCFNRNARNNRNFWRPLAYIPNLSHGKSKSDKTEPIVKVQDEHKCLALAFRSLRELTQSGRVIKANVNGRLVSGKVWIHFFIGDTAGNNAWLGHYNGSGKLKRSYRDCHCKFDSMNRPYHSCEYVTLDEMRQAKRRKTSATTAKEKRIVFHDISKHDIRNALTEPHMPLSDQVHGPYKMTPPELLHISGSGLIKYMFQTLKYLLLPMFQIIIDGLHQRLFQDSARQSEKDFPRGSNRNGILDGTKTQSTENRGNLFLLLCLAHTVAGRRALAGFLDGLGVGHRRFCSFIMIYLAMEEWMHSSNTKQKVRSAHVLVTHVLRELKAVFPRKKGNGLKLPKFHGMTKMVPFMKLFGSAINFFSGPGESFHKYFVKAPGNNTQRRVSEFGKQIAERVYENMICEIAHEANVREDNMYEKIGKKSSGAETNENTATKLVGKYYLTVVDVGDNGLTGNHEVKWDYDGKKKTSSALFNLHPDLIRVLYKEISERGREECLIVGFTEMRTECNGEKFNFHAHPWYNGAPWYDWGYIAYMIEDEDGVEVLKYYPSLILGFVQIDDEEVMAVVRTSVEDLPWNKRLQDFVSSFHIGTNFEQDYTLVPVSAISHPLFVFKDYEGEHTKFFAHYLKETGRSTSIRK